MSSTPKTSSSTLKMASSGQTTKGRVVPSLYNMAAKSTGEHVGCEMLETVNPPLDENTLKKVACYAFPVNETHIKLISELTTTDNTKDWTDGVNLYQKGRVDKIRQVGFMVAATVINLNMDGVAKVTVTFERRRITSTKCSQCPGMIWCRHIVAVIIARMRNPSKVPIQAPVTDILLSLTREQLQKIIQYAVNESPGDMLGRVFSYIDAVRDPYSTINMMKGYPDPTFGVQMGDKTTDQLTLEKLRRNFDKCLSEDKTEKIENCSLTDIEKFMTSTQSGKERYLQTSISLLKQNDIDLAGRAFIQIAQSLHEAKSISTTMATKKMMMDVERWFSFFIASFSGQIRQDMLTAALDINKRSFCKELNAGSEMRCVKLQSIGDANNNAKGTLMGENRNVAFYEPIVANFLPKIPKSLSDLYDGTVQLKLNSYKGPLDVMLFRFEKLVHIDQFMNENKDTIRRQICLLGCVILQKLMKLTHMFTILGGGGKVISSRKHEKDCLDVDMTKILPVMKEIPDSLTEVTNRPNLTQKQTTDEKVDLWWKRRLIIGHLSNLIHAYKCQQDKNGTCNDQICIQMKGLLAHIKCCTERAQCKHVNCYSTKLILEHWNSCSRSDCKACNDIWEHDDVDYCSPLRSECEPCHTVRRTYCHWTCKEFRCCMCAAGKTEAWSEDGDMCPHYINLLLGNKCDENVCSFCKHIKTKSLERLNDKSRLCGNVKCRLCSRSLWDSTHMNTECVTDFMLAYDRVYRSAQAALGLSGSGPDIHSEYEDHNKTIAASTRKKKKTNTEEIRWKENTSLEYRNHLVNKFVQILLPVSAQSGEKFINAVAFSTRLEQQVFDKAKSKAEYFHLLVDKMYRIIKEMEERRKEKGKGKRLTQGGAEDGASTAKRQRRLGDSLEEEKMHLGNNSSGDDAYDNLGDSIDDDLIVFEGLSKKQLFYSLLYVSVQVLEKGNIPPIRSELATVFSAAFRAFEITCSYPGVSAMDTSWSSLADKLVEALKKRRDIKTFEVVSHMYATVLKGKKRHIPLTLVSFLIDYGNLSEITKAQLAYEALTESLYPLSKVKVKTFNGSSIHHYTNLMAVLFDEFPGKARWQFLLHVRYVQDKLFVIKAMDYFMNGAITVVEHGKIILDILVMRFIEEKWIMPSETERMEQIIKTLGLLSSLIPVSCTTQLLTHWFKVCVFFTTQQKIKQIINFLKLASEDGKCLPYVAHPLIENYLTEGCQHGKECGSLIKVFYSTKEDLERVVGKIEGNQTKYTHVCLMKITIFVQKTTGATILSCQLSRKCLLMMLEAIIRSLRILPDARPDYLKLYEPSFNEEKYWRHFLQLIVTSLTEDIITTSQFTELLDKLKKVLVMNVDLMLQFIQFLDQSEIGKRGMKNWLGNSLVECYNKAFVKEVEKINNYYYSSLVQRLRIAMDKCEKCSHNGKTNFVRDVLEVITSRFHTKKKLCLMINEEFSL